MIAEIIKQNEGLRLKPYKDSEGIQTIGYGFNLEEGISQRIAEFLFSEKYNQVHRDFHHLITKVIGGDLDGELVNGRKAALYDMLYHMGLPRVLGFKKMLQAIKEKDWNTAQVEIMDSRYAEQTPARAYRNSLMMLTGEVTK